MTRSKQLPLLEPLEPRELFSATITGFAKSAPTTSIGPAIVQSKSAPAKTPSPTLADGYGGNVVEITPDHWFSFTITAQSGRILSGVVHLGTGTTAESVPFIGVYRGDKLVITWGKGGNRGVLTGTVSPDGYAVDGKLANKSQKGGWGTVRSDVVLFLDWTGPAPT